MRSRWEPIQIECRFDAKDGYKKHRLEEVGEILYLYFSQLDKDQIQNQISVTVSSNKGRT